MKTFEYDMISKSPQFYHDVRKKMRWLSEMGSKGWELIQIIDFPRSEVTRFYFKREIIEQPVNKQP